MQKKKKNTNVYRLAWFYLDPCGKKIKSKAKTAKHAARSTQAAGIKHLHVLTDGTGTRTSRWTRESESQQTSILYEKKKKKIEMDKNQTQTV